MQDLLLVGDLRHRERERRVYVAEQEIDLVAIDQLARLQHGRARVAAGGILHDQLDVAVKNASLRIDLFDRELTANQFVFASPCKGASQGIVEADLHGIGGSRAQGEGTSNLQDADRETGLEKGAAADTDPRSIDRHEILPWDTDHRAAPTDRRPSTSEWKLFQPRRAATGGALDDSRLHLFYEGNVNKALCVCRCRFYSGGMVALCSVLAGKTLARATPFPQKCAASIKVLLCPLYVDPRHSIARDQRPLRVRPESAGLVPARRNDDGRT